VTKTFSSEFAAPILPLLTNAKRFSVPANQASVFMRKNETAQTLKPNRREFLKLGGLAAAAVVGQTTLPTVTHAASEPLSNPGTANAMPTRNLGKTGYRVGIFSLGGQSALERAHNDAVAVPLINRALDLGVNYLDTSSIYGGT